MKTVEFRRRGDATISTTVDVKKAGQMHQVEYFYIADTIFFHLKIEASNLIFPSVRVPSSCSAGWPQSSRSSLERRAQMETHR